MAPERLADQRYVTLQLRVLVDRRDTLVQGELGGTSLDGGTEHWVRFRGATGLAEAVRSWLAATPDSQGRTDLPSDRPRC